MSAAMQSSGRPTWRQNLAHALTATVLTAVVVTPIFSSSLDASRCTWSTPIEPTSAIFPALTRRALLPR